MARRKARVLAVGKSQHTAGKQTATKRFPARTSAGKSTRVVKKKRPFMTELELSKLGDGHIAYIREMTSKEAKQLYPSIQGLPKGINLFALHGADGTPLALTDSLHAALGHAQEGELEIASVH